MPTRREWREALVCRLIDEHGGQDPEVIIERYAEHLRLDAGQHELPIDPAVVASCLGVRRRRADYSFAGRILAEPNGQLVMDINQRDSLERQRFTEAHEMIHPAFPGFESELRYRLDASMERYAENKEEEYLCDLGAAALLMPTELVADRYTVKGGMKDVEQLHRDAQVSIEAAANRVVALSDEPAVMLCLTVSHKPADRPALRKGLDVPKRLRVRYALASHLNVYVPRFKGADDGSVFHEAVVSSGICSGTTTLPGAEHAGLFRVQAKRYGSDDRERVIAIARPTA